MSYEPFNKETASVTDRIAWALCQIVDDDAPLRWTRYRFAAECIAKNPEVMNDLRELSGASPPPVAGVPQTLRDRLQQQCSAWGTYWRGPDAHGVILTPAQATELLADALGVEVEITAAAPPEGAAPDAAHTDHGCGNAYREPV